MLLFEVTCARTTRLFLSSVAIFQEETKVEPQAVDAHLIRVFPLYRDFDHGAPLKVQEALCLGCPKKQIETAWWADPKRV
jgi:hypothetical protein